MGRGRAKAKQVKVARRLKYNTSGTDLDRLREELGVTQSSQDEDDYDSYENGYDDLADRYAQYLDDEDDDERQDSTGRR